MLGDKRGGGLRGGSIQKQTSAHSLGGMKTRYSQGTVRSSGKEVPMTGGRTNGGKEINQQHPPNCSEKKKKRKKG